jgi:hypothetical protein
MELNFSVSLSNYADRQVAMALENASEGKHP